MTGHEKNGATDGSPCRLIASAMHRGHAFHFCRAQKAQYDGAEQQPTTFSGKFTFKIVKRMMWIVQHEIPFSLCVLSLLTLRDFMRFFSLIICN